MSLVWRILRDEIEAGNIEIDTLNAEPDALQDIKKVFPNIFANEFVSSIIEHESTLKNSTSLISHESPIQSTADYHVSSYPTESFEPFETLGEIETIGTTENEDSDCEIIYSGPAVFLPLAMPKAELFDKDYGLSEQEKREESERLKAAKQYRKALLSGKTKKRKQKRQSKIYREIVYEKLSTKFAIPPEDFRDVVDEIMEEEFPDHQIETGAIMALQHESEMMLTKMMCLASHLADYADRETLRKKDIDFLKFLMSKNMEGCSFAM